MASPGRNSRYSSRKDGPRGNAAALGLRGEIDLSVGREFHVPSLFIPLENYLLRREGIEVTKEQSEAFYKLCMHALLHDIREFPQSLLQTFGTVKPYLV